MQHPPLRHAVAASGLVVAACAVLMVLAAMDGSIQQQQHAVVLKGMSGKSAQQDLDSYFDSMNQNVQKEQALAAQHLKRETSMLSKQEQDEELKTRGVATSKPAKHGLKAKVANAKLSGYFQKQALAIKQHEKQVAEERNENEPQALSTMAANKDLNSYFDSLNVATTKEGKLDLLAKQVCACACAELRLILHVAIDSIFRMRDSITDTCMELPAPTNSNTKPPELPCFFLLSHLCSLLTKAPPPLCSVPV